MIDLTSDLAVEVRNTLDALYNKLAEEHGELVGSMLFALMAKHNGDITLSQIRKLDRYERFIFEECAPCKKGDLVELTVEIDFEKSYGWKGAQGFLKPGAKGEVANIRLADKRGGGFVFYVGVRWFNQSWISSITGEINPYEPEKWSIYTHPAGDLRKLPSNLPRETALKLS